MDEVTSGGDGPGEPEKRDEESSGVPVAGGGSIPLVVWLLIAVIFLAVWGLLSLTR
jgi:hypothetical protein